MPIYKKIPHRLKGQAIAIGPYAIFCTGLLRAAAIAKKLQGIDEHKGIPAHGTVQYNKESIYYCRYGFVNDPDIYTATPK
jgi:hypothetical protein